MAWRNGKCEVCSHLEDPENKDGELNAHARQLDSSFETACKCEICNCATSLVKNAAPATIWLCARHRMRIHRHRKNPQSTNTYAWALGPQQIAPYMMAMPAMHQPQPMVQQAPMSTMYTRGNASAPVTTSMLTMRRGDTRAESILKAGGVTYKVDHPIDLSTEEVWLGSAGKHFPALERIRKFAEAFGLDENQAMSTISSDRFKENKAKMDSVSVLSQFPPPPPSAGMSYTLMPLDPQPQEVEHHEIEMPQTSEEAKRDEYGEPQPKKRRMYAPEWQEAVIAISSKDVDDLHQRLARQGYKGKDGVSRAALLFIVEQCEQWHETSGKKLQDYTLLKRNVIRVFANKYPQLAATIKINGLNTAVTAVLKHLIPMNGYKGSKKDITAERDSWAGISLKEEVAAQLMHLPPYQVAKLRFIAKGTRQYRPPVIIDEEDPSMMPLPAHTAPMIPGTQIMPMPGMMPAHGMVSQAPQYDIVTTGGLYFVRIFAPCCDVQELVREMQWDLQSHMLFIRASYMPTPTLPDGIAREYGVGKNGAFIQQCELGRLGPFELKISLPTDINDVENPTCVVSETGPIVVIKRVEQRDHIPTMPGGVPVPMPPQPQEAMQHHLGGGISPPSHHDGPTSMHQISQPHQTHQGHLGHDQHDQHDQHGQHDQHDQHDQHQQYMSHTPTGQQVAMMDIPQPQPRGHTSQHGHNQQHTSGLATDSGSAMNVDHHQQ